MAPPLKQLMTRNALTVRFAIVPALALLSLTGLLYLGTTRLVADELSGQAALRVQQRSTLLASRLQNQMTAFVRGVKQLVRFETLNHAAGGAPSRNEMEWVQSELPAFAWIGFLSPTGRVEVATKGWLQGQNVHLRPVFVAAKERLSIADFHPVVALAPYLDPAGVATAKVADIGAPVLDRNGRLHGVIAAHITDDWVEDLAEKTVTDIETGRLGLTWFVVTSNGTVISRSALTFSPPVADGQTHEVLSTDGKRYLAATAELGQAGDAVRSLGWKVVVATETNAALAPLREFDRTLAVFAFAGCLLFSLGGFIVARRTIRPFDRFFSNVRSRFEAAGGQKLMPYHDYLEVLGEELSAELPHDRGTGGDILQRLARDAQQLKRVIDHLPMGIAISSPDFRVEYVNPAYSRMLGWTSAEVQGRRTAEYLFSEVEREQFVAQLDTLGRSPGEFMARFDAVCANGSRLPILWHLLPLHDARGAFAGALAVVQDISREAKANRRVMALSNRLELFADAARDYVLALLDDQGHILTWSRGAQTVLGWSSDEAVARGFPGLFTAAEVSLGVPGQLLGAARRRGQCEIEARLQRRDGTDLVGQGMLYALPTGSDNAHYALIVRDSTSQHEAARKLRLSEQQLAGLTRRLLEQEKQTTQRLAQALHDELGQTLSAMRLMYDAGRNAAAPGHPLPAWVERFDRLIQESNRQVRQVLTELRPPLLDEHGLLAALDNELRQRQTLLEQPVLALDSTGVSPDQRWSADVEYAAFMIAREAVNNALKHAAPSKVVVTVAGDDLSFTLTIADDSVAAGKAPIADKPGHLGLVGMRERAFAIGAALLITPAPGGGTQVTLQWEMDDEPPVLG